MNEIWVVESDGERFAFVDADQARRWARLRHGTIEKLPLWHPREAQAMLLAPEEGDSRSRS